MRAVGEIRETSERRIGEVERKMASDVVTAEKLARLDEVIERQQRLLDAHALKAARPPLVARLSQPTRHCAREHKAAFERYIRRGVEQGLPRHRGQELLGRDERRRRLPRAAGNRGRGQSLAPRYSPIRAISDIRQVSAAIYQKPYAWAKWARDGWPRRRRGRRPAGRRSRTSRSRPWKLYAMPAATQMVLDDSIVDMDAWIADEVRTAFAIQEGRAFVSGDGRQQAERLPGLPRRQQRRVVLGQPRRHPDRRVGRLPCGEPVRQTH